MPDCFEDILISPNDLAYFAGIIDGEGCICISRTRNHIEKTNLYIAKLLISNTDEGLINWIERRFNGRIGISPPRKINHRIAYTINWQNWEAINLLKKVEKFLIIKRNRATFLINNWPQARERNPNLREKVYQKISNFNQGRIT